MHGVIQKGNCTGRSILNFLQLHREEVSEGEKVAVVSWCQQPHLIIFELDFHADFGRQALWSMKTVPGRNKRQRILGKPIVEGVRGASD